MPWQETSTMDERARFVIDVETSEYSMSDLCRHYGISRKTGYKWWHRYLEGGIGELADRSRAPHHHPRAVRSEVKEAIEAIKARYCRWGPRKIRAKLQRDYPEWERYPAASTIGAYLRQKGLTHPRRHKAKATPSEVLTRGNAPNEVWCIDFKGHFRTDDGHRCNPLTISDEVSRYIICCRHVDQMRYRLVKMQCETVFREYGLPKAIRSDNGAPFSGHGLCGLSRLSYWWIRLGISPERIEPGRPQQNGRHERMHKTLKAETAQPPASTLQAQQKAFDAFRREFNEERPHEALEMRTPAERYIASPRELPSRLPPVNYPAHMEVRKVSTRGEIYYLAKRIFITESLIGDQVGIEQVSDDLSALYFCTYLLGYIDHRIWKVRTARDVAAAGRLAGQPRAKTH